MRSVTSPTTRRRFLVLAGAVTGAPLRWCFGDERKSIPTQPYFAEVARALDTLARSGAPVAPKDAEEVRRLAGLSTAQAVDAAEKILDRYTLARIDLDNKTAALAAGGAPRVLVEQGWRPFLIRVANSIGSTATIELTANGRSGLSQFDAALTPGHMSFEPAPVYSISQRAYNFDTVNKAPIIAAEWMLSKLESDARLHGFQIEYHVVEIFSRDSGQRTALFSFALSPQSERDTSYRYAHADFAFNCLATNDVALRVSDSDGRGCVASLTIRDGADRVYPPQAIRYAPDLAFQPQIYRADGETVRLPAGRYSVEARRGPEYLRNVQTVTIGPGQSRIAVTLQRWIDPRKWGWYSGDTHIHAAGCTHYDSPTEGVSPETIIRQVRGEGLAIGDVLNWGAGWYYQKQFFSGRAISPPSTLEHPEIQSANNANLRSRITAEDQESTVRYDVEVSGFPSSHAGHLVLLRLRQTDYPGTKLIEEWPSWNLPVLKWARSQGALGGYAHCGLGMVVDSNELPNYIVPPMDGLGTQEAIVDVTHGLVDFLSGCDTNPVAELNAWYHMMNCGFRMAMVGETDYPCLSDERLGVGRSYVRLKDPPVGEEGYEAWVRGMAQGRLYCGDGRSHFLDFTVNGQRSGEQDPVLDTAGPVPIEALVAARLEPTPQVAPRPSHDQLILGESGWAWHLELARIADTRKVPVELVVNGLVADKALLIADGTPQRIAFKASISRSSWIALRILPSAHTHPVFIQVNRKPIRASRRSARWCRACVDKVWETKSPLMRASERPAAAEAFAHARSVYDRIIAECEIE